MSEIGIISKQYGALVTKTDKINDSVIVLKKQFLLRSNPEKSKTIVVSDKELEGAKNDMLIFIDYLKELQKVNHEPDFGILPGKTILELKKLFDRKPGIDKTLHKIRGKLKKDKFLEKEQFDALDEIVAVLDNERSMLFKKLRTARG